MLRVRLFFRSIYRSLSLSLSLSLSHSDALNPHSANEYLYFPLNYSFGTVAEWTPVVCGNSVAQCGVKHNMREIEIYSINYFIERLRGTLIGVISCVKIHVPGWMHDFFSHSFYYLSFLFYF